jgi:hypothetical protein
VTSANGPRFEDLVGDDLPAEERARLERVHELLIAAGPPPELPPHLAEAPPAPQARVIPIRRARWRTAALVAAATLLIAFGAGWLAGDRTAGGDHVEFTVAMTGTEGAHASLAVLSNDTAGNWPMKMTVTGLHPLSGGRTYTLWLTRKGALEAQCGTFVVGAGTTTVHLNAPFRLNEYTGWVVVVSGTTTPLLRTETV